MQVARRGFGFNGAYVETGQQASQGPTRLMRQSMSTSSNMGVATFGSGGGWQLGQKEQL